ncbi:MAG: hypothetical protein QNJ54_13935 [Prochloraceae cyanobacterium]|nr:hypothetical protein [Prochloraceae cyanobacterium]
MEKYDKYGQQQKKRFSQTGIRSWVFLLFIPFLKSNWRDQKYFLLIKKAQIPLFPIPYCLFPIPCSLSLSLFSRIVLTIVDGKPVYGVGEFKDQAPPPIPVSPDWSPVARYGGDRNKTVIPADLSHRSSHLGCCFPLKGDRFSNSSLSKAGNLSGFWGSLGCECFV